jgi:hypothetical protein
MLMIGPPGPGKSRLKWRALTTNSHAEMRQNVVTFRVTQMRGFFKSLGDKH